MSSSHKAVLKSFGILRNSFARSTIPANIKAFELDLNDRIAAYNSLKSEADPSKQVNEIPVLDMPKLNPIFEDYCKDGEKFFSDESLSEEKAKQYNTAIEEYLFMKLKTDAELQIMEANRVGSDKDISKIVRSTAGMVGLQMPKLYDPNAEKK